MDHYFDREGRPITLQRWAELFEDRAYRFLADQTVNEFRVATIWTGFDPYRSDSADYVAEPPLIFETTIFWHGTHEIAHDSQRQHATEAEARACQADFVHLADILSVAPW
jgi:hypothetical protein